LGGGAANALMETLIATADASMAIWQGNAPVSIDRTGALG